MERAIRTLQTMLLLLVTAMAAQAQEVNKLFVPDITGAESSAITLPVNLSNTNADIVAMQFELSVPQGVMTLKESDASLSERKDDHTVVASSLGGGRYRFMVYSPSNKPLKANSGEVLGITAAIADAVDHDGVFPIELSNVVLSDSKGNNVATPPANGTFRIKASADFTVSGVSVSPASVMPGSAVDVSWTVRNAGAIASTGGWSERVSLVTADGTEKSLGAFYSDAQSLGAGSAVSRSVSIELPALLGIEGGAKVKVTVVPNSDSGEDIAYQKNNMAETSGYSLNIGKRLVMELPASAIEEGTSSPVRCKLSRSGNWIEAQTFSLSKLSGDSRLVLPETVTIGKGQSSAYFYVTVSDNDILDDVSAFEIQALGNGYEPVAAVLTIEDDEYPQLTLAASKSDIMEGETFRLTVTTERASAEPIVVSLVSEAAKRFSHPATITIPAGETSAAVDVTAVDNEEVELQASVAFKVSAEKYQSGECIIMLGDNDLPAIDLELSPVTVSESAGPVAIVAKLRRTTNTDKKITIQLSDDSDGDVYYPTKSVVLDKGVEEAQFSLGVVDNAVVDGDKQVNITAAVYVSSCSCSASGTSVGVVTKTVEIIDNDGPSLNVSSSKSTLLEGNEDGIVLTVTRNTNTETALTVNISSDYDEGLSYNRSVTIPAGAKSADVTVKAAANASSGDDKTIVFTVEAADFSKGTCWVMLTDQTLPDVQLSAISVSKPEAEVGGSVDVSVTVNNIGAAELPEVTKIGVYVSNSSTPVANLYTQQPLAPGGQVTLSKTITLPAAVGSYEIYAVANDGQAVKELLYVNNTSERVAVKTTSPFSAAVSTDKKVYQQGETVKVSGHVSGNAVADAEVEVYIINDGLRQTVKATADANGDFTAEYQPYEAQMGHFVVGACYPGEGLTEEKASFDVYGLKRTSNTAITCDVLMGEAYSGKFALSNPGVLSLTGVKATVVSKPENCDVNVIVPTTVAGGGNVDVTYSLKGAAMSPGYDWEQIKVLVETAEGPSVTTTLYYYCRNPKGQLQASVPEIKTTMVKGASRDYPITITNIGKGETGKITLSLPDWMSTATPREMSSLAQGETATVILRFTPTDAMQLNVPVTGTIGINCENGNGIPLSYSVEPVSESTGTLVVDVCDEYTYYTTEGPHVAGAQVLVKHPTTGAVVAQGLIGDNGIYSVSLPEGYYSISVTADKHDSYANNVLVDPESETKETVNLSFRAITVDWKVDETEIEDEYAITTTVKYETNVPMPVVELSVPSSIPAKELQEGESLIFYATLTNKGLVTAQDVELELPTEFSTLSFEALAYNNEPFNLAPQQSVTIPVQVTKNANTATYAKGRAKPIDDDPCASQMGTLYFWDCGLDRKWHRYKVALQVGSCKSDDSSTWDNSGNGSYGGGGYGGGLTVVPHTGPGGVISSVYNSSTNDNPIKHEDTGCEPCQNQFLIDLVDCGLQLVPAYKTLKAVIGCVSSVYEVIKLAQEKPTVTQMAGAVLEAASTCMAAKGAGSGDKNQSRAEKRAEAIESIVTTLGELTGKLAKGSDDPEEGALEWDDVVGTLGSLAQSLSTLAGFDYEHLEDLFCPLKLIKPCDKEGTPETASYAKSRTRSNNGYPSYIQEFQKAVSLVLMDEMIVTGIQDKFYGDVAWLNSEGEQINKFLVNLNSSLDDNSIISDAAVPSIIASRPDNISEEEARKFVARWNNTILGTDDANTIDLDKIGEFMETINIVDEEVSKMGYESIDECYESEYSKCLSRLEEADNSVCASISLQLSQTMTMTRQAFRGTLTVFNGNEEKAMENVRLNLEVRDEDGTLATAHEFQINAENLDGFTGELNLTDGWSLAANETGTATILFIPTKYAALETGKDYSFGGSLSYIDPFTGLEVTRDLYPVTLTVKPSPNLDLTYFMQRDIYGDDPLTKDVVEPCEPAEFALLINNKGYGDATNVRMVTNQPEIVENEKGLLINFELLSSQLNGKDNTLALGGSVATDFGTIPAQSTAYAQWWLQSSLLGHFTDYDVEATHVTSYGNEDLSLLDNVTIHELIHGFTVDGNTDTAVRGFLVNDITDAEDLPDMVYFTDGRQEESVAAASVSMTRNSGTEYAVTITPSEAGWNYGSVSDLTAGKQKLVSVVRQSDGAELPVDNFWFTDRTLRDGKDPLYEYRMHVVAELNGEETFFLTFEPKPETELEVERFTGVPEEGTVLTSPLTSVGIVFNKDIDGSTFTTDDINLNCQGVKVDLSQATITKVNDSEYSIGLAGATLESGYYVLTVQTAGITDAEGFAGVTGKSVSWLQDTDATSVLDVFAKGQGFSIHPLPLRDVMYVEGDFSTIEKLVITDANGSVRIKEKNVPCGSAVDVAQLPSGIYIVSVLTDNGAFIKKVLKK